jgi:galactonate dehydratase
MKITAIKTLVCRMDAKLDFRQGLDRPRRPPRLGRATLEWHTRSVVGAVEDLAPLLSAGSTRIEYLLADDVPAAFLAW